MEPKEIALLAVCAAAVVFLIVLIALTLKLSGIKKRAEKEGKADHIASKDNGQIREADAVSIPSASVAQKSADKEFATRKREDK